MNTDRWRRIEAIYYDALDRDPAERERYVAEACRGDDALLHDVTSLLEAGDDSGSVRDLVLGGARLVQGAPASGGVDASDIDMDDIRATEVPQRLGPYKILGTLGRGGLGTVYLAERDDEHYSMRVAIKLVRRGLDTDDILRRLRQERQILARLDHPNITRLLDGGSTERGQPYLVMEYVDGTSLDTYADQRRLSVRARLGLVLQVCEAVSLAHRNLVIHRDLKPSNVLVTDDGTVKLLDFGIAKLLDSDAETAPTRPEQRLLTPEYASPEQLRGLPLSTATDVYSLGAMLGRLLTGCSPGSDSRPTSNSWTPARASQRLSQLPKSEADEIAAQRGVTAARLEQQIRGDLDTILQKAMAQDPAERYASISELADDLSRHLDDRPVRARAPSLGIRGFKLIRRNPLVSLAVAVIIVSLVAGVYATAWQAQRARRAQVEAERVSTFLGDLLEASKPELSRGEPVLVRSVLDRGAERIATELTGEPDVQARLMTTMGQAYFSLGLYDRAEQLHRDALEIRLRRRGENHVDIAESDIAESANHLAGALMESGQLEAAEPLFEQALRIRREHPDVDPARVADTLNNLGILHRRLRDTDKAEAYFAQALDIYRSDPGERQRDIAASFNNLGVLYLHQGRFVEAEEMLRQAVDVRERLHGDHHPETLTSLANLASALRLQNDLEAAELLLRKALVIGRELLGPNHPDVGKTLNSLAKIAGAKGEVERAASWYEQAMEIFVATLGKNSLEVAKASTSLGESWMLAGRAAEAEAALRNSLEILGHYGEQPELARSLEFLGTLLCGVAEPTPEAETLLRRAVDVRRNVHADDVTSRWRMAIAEGRLGDCLLTHGDTAAAAPLLRASYEELLRRFGDENSLTGEAAQRLEHLRRIEQQ